MGRRLTIKEFDFSKFDFKLLKSERRDFINKFYVFQQRQNQRQKMFASVFNLISIDNLKNTHDKNNAMMELLNSVCKNFENIKINIETILNFNAIIFDDDPSIGKGLRQNQNYIFSRSKEMKLMPKLIFTPPPPNEIKTALLQLCKSFNKEWSRPDINKLYLIPIFFDDFVLIHPFTNGNGRVGRLLATVLFLQAGFSVFKYVSLETEINKRRNLYHRSLHRTNDGWYENKNDYWPFVLNMLLTLQDAYKELDRKFIIEGNKLNHNPQWLETALLYSIIPYRVNDIVSALPDFSTDLIQQTIDKLVSEGKLAKLSPGNIYKSLIWDKK